MMIGTLFWRCSIIRCIVDVMFIIIEKIKSQMELQQSKKRE
jgi:hypothetical protein